MTWNDLSTSAGIITNGQITEFQVRQVKTCSGINGATDLIICDRKDVDSRIAARSSGTTRSVGPERLYMARAFARDAGTAAALMVRAVIGRWIRDRGWCASHDAHETEALNLIDKHLSDAGVKVQPIGAPVAQVPATHIVAPIKHEGAVDVLCKAMRQLGRQIDGRVVIVFCHGPEACSV